MSTQILKKPEIWPSDGIFESGIGKSQIFSTGIGVLYQGDCLELLPFVRNEVVDTVFAILPLIFPKYMVEKLTIIALKMITFHGAKVGWLTVFAFSSRAEQFMSTASRNGILFLGITSGNADWNSGIGSP